MNLVNEISMESNIGYCKKCEITYPLDKNNFFIINSLFENVCIRCSDKKRCSICLKDFEHNVSNFAKNGNRLRSYCKDCMGLASF